MEKLPMTDKLVTEAVLSIAKQEGISPEELGEMVNRAAITTHERGNRRYHDWVFNVEVGVVRNMTKATMAHFNVPGRTMDLTVEDVCPYCDGEGCKKCGHIGFAVIHYEAKKKR
jgi:hypothetical protein